MGFQPAVICVVEEPDMMPIRRMFVKIYVAYIPKIEVFNTELGIFNLYLAI